MRTAVRQTWRVRLVEALDALAAWAQDKGAWRWISFGMGMVLVGMWWCGIGGILGGSNEEAQDGTAGTFGHGLISFGFLVGGAVLASPILASWVAGPFLRFIDAVYLGGSAIERPPLTYVVAERRLQEGRFEDAAIEFERLAFWHPGEARAYVEGIRAARLAGDRALALRLFRRGLLRCPGAADQLRTSYATGRAAA